MTLTHIIGPQTKHALHPASLVEIERRLASIVAQGRDRMPREVDFTTYTLRYNQCAWVTVEALGEHWQAAHVLARVKDDMTINVKTTNIAGLKFDIPAGLSPLALHKPVVINIDDSAVTVPGPSTDRSWTVRLEYAEGSWRAATAPLAPGRKRPGQQGPIDDAFLESFVFVRPTGKSNADIERWTNSELQRAMTEWRRQMRGVARVIDDTQLDDATIAASNLVLWGTPRTNAVLGKIVARLPLEWNDYELKIGGAAYAAANHLPALIYPNPLNPERYVVLNSSFTYREYDYLNNARQVPKLPDWAVIDLRTPPNSRSPGKIVAADFFDEAWQVKPAR